MGSLLFSRSLRTAFSDITLIFAKKTTNKSNLMKEQV